MRNVLIFTAVILVVWWFFFRQGPVETPADGTRVSQPPQQTATEMASWTAGDFTVRPLARYRLKARVLSRKRYFLDPTSGIAPIDLALGWGDMSDSAVLRHLDISQSGRWYQFTYGADCPVAHGTIATQSANVHCLPGDDSVRRDLLALRVNEFVEMRGFLVEVTHRDNPAPWRSSLVRDDEGAGACEIFWIDDLQVIDP